MSTKKVEQTPWPVDEAEELDLNITEPFGPVVPSVEDEKQETDRYKERRTRIAQRRQHVDDLLNQPLDRSLVKQRYGGKTKDGKVFNLDYLEWPTVVRNLNRIFGYGHWNMDVVHRDYLGQQPKSGAPYAVVVTVKLSVIFDTEDYESAEYTNVGTGEVRYDDWKGLDMAVKGAVWDGVKRCATALGDQFGLSLYDKETPAEDSEESYEKQETGARVSQFKPRQIPPSNGTSGVGESFACEDCGKSVTGYTSKTGKVYSTQDLYEMSVRQTGGGYCYTCKANHTA